MGFVFGGFFFEGALEVKDTWYAKNGGKWITKKVLFKKTNTVIYRNISSALLK